jgi:hypothetical protein
VPFTISHAAAVLPLHRWTREKLPLAALMIGSMAPDFAYFIPGDPGRVTTHSIAGVFTFCLPVSLVLWLLFVRVLEQPTLALMPESWSARIVPPHREWTLKRLLIASVAVILGAFTHLLWDAFTHADTLVTNTFPVLNSAAVEIGGARVAWFSLLQHASTVIGMAFLTIWAVRRLRVPPAPDPPRHFLPSVSNRMRAGAVVLLLSASFVYAIARFMAYPDNELEYRLFHFAIGGMTAFALAWLAIAIFISWRARTAARLDARE